MDIATLIDRVTTAKKQSQAQLAAAMGKNPARLSEWKSGKMKPDANEIAYLAHEADLPILETVAEVEAKLHPAYAAIWQAALRKC